MKIKPIHIGLIIILILGYLWWTGAFKFEVKPPDEVGLVSVTKPVDFYLLDKYGGGGVASATLTVYNVDLVQLESLTTASDGTIATSAAYPSGTIFKVKADDGASSLKWFEVTVPKMTPADAQALTVIGPITLEMFDYTAPTITVQDSAGNTYADDGDWNKTSGGTPGTDSGVLTVTWFQGTDNDGYMSSHDPINDVNWKALLVAKCSGTNYELVTVTGFTYSIEKGSAMYYATYIDPTELTKWKVGAEYKLPGTGAFTFSLDVSGYSGTAANLDFYIYYYADWDNFVAKGSFGPDSLSVISGAPHTIDLVE